MDIYLVASSYFRRKFDCSHPPPRTDRQVIYFIADFVFIFLVLILFTVLYLKAVFKLTGNIITIINHLILMKYLVRVIFVGYIV
jgi:hypothetical protein